MSEDLKQSVAKLRKEVGWLRSELRVAKRRIFTLAARGTVSRVKDSTKTQSLQANILQDESCPDIERFQNYGFSSVPATGSEAIMLFINGERAHPIAVVVEERTKRPKGLKSGEVVVYHRDGHKVYLKENGDVAVVPHETGKVKLGSELATLAVGRVTDPVTSSAAMATWMSQVTTAVATMATAFNAPPAPMASLGPGTITPPVVAPNPIGTIQSGASKVDAL